MCKTYLRSSFLNLWTFQKYPRIDDAHTVSFSNINSNTRLSVLLKSDFSTFLLWFQNKIWHIYIQILIIQITRNFNSESKLFFWTFDKFFIVYLECRVNSILNCEINSFHGTVTYVSVYDEYFFNVLFLFRLNSWGNIFLLYHF